MTPLPSEQRSRSARSWLSVFALLAAATAVSGWFDGEISLTSQAMIYLIVVVIAAYALERLAAVICAVAAVTAFNFFFVPPRYTLAVEHHEHLIALAAMLLVGLLVSYLAGGLRRESEAARQGERRARELRMLAAEIAETTTETDAVRVGRDALVESCGGTIGFALATDGGDLREPHAWPRAVVEALRCCIVEAAPIGPGTGRWPSLDAWYLPLGVEGHVVGAVRVEPAVADSARREHAEALCSIVAQGLWRLRLSEATLAARAELQRQQLQGTLLAAVSHDLRTPLAAIVAAASSLQQQRSRLPKAEQDRMLGSIVAEARYLTTITENTLQLLRLSGGSIDARREWESVEEIVGSVLALVRGRDPARRIRADVPPALPLVKGDATLLAQLLANLLDNACKYSDGAVEVVVRPDADRLRIDVQDRGPGIPVEDEARLFEPFFRHRHETGARGAGLGLALCSVIAAAHGGELAMHRRTGGGSRFTLTLPIAAQPLAELAA